MRNGFFGMVFALLTLVPPTHFYLAVASDPMEITACLTKQGKLTRVQFGRKPKKECTGNQRKIIFPTAAKTDEMQAQLDQLKAKK